MSWGSSLVRKETWGKNIYKNLGWILRRGIVFNKYLLATSSQKSGEAAPIQWREENGRKNR